MNIEQLAEICHEIDRALLNAGPQFSVTAPDEELQLWPNTPPLYRDELMLFVQNILDGISVADAHERWVLDRRNHGWGFGEFYAPYKQHPNLLDFDQIATLARARLLVRAAVVKLFSGRQEQDPGAMQEAKQREELEFEEKVKQLEALDGFSLELSPDPSPETTKGSKKKGK